MEAHIKHVPHFYSPLKPSSKIRKSICSIMSQRLQMISFILHCLIPVIFSSPSVKPNILISPSSNLHFNSSLDKTTSRAEDDFEVHCLKRPRMHHIDTSICKPALNRILTAPDAQKEKTYTSPTTKFSAGPCHIELKKSHGPFLVAMKAAEIVLAVGAILNHCGKVQGSGWAQLLPSCPWYILAYGDPQLRQDLPLDPSEPLDQGR